jgi:hypothetical protein
MKSKLIYVFAFFSVATAASIASAVDLPAMAGGLALHLDEASGAYTVSSAADNWIFGGSLKTAVNNVAVRSGKDRVGGYHEIAFHLEASDVPLTGSMRVYDQKSVALFSMSADVDTPKPTIPFPSFTKVPSELHSFSYADKVFSPPIFAAAKAGSPWLLFDDQMHAAIISPAAHFAVSIVTGDGKSEVSGEFRPTLAQIPAGFAQQTLLAIDQGINRTWDTWGHALTDLQGKDRPANDADPGLKYLGYWTDNGAFYYYHYDKDKGYAGTLLALADHFHQEQIPVRYLQLDSWWYYKSLTAPNGKEGKPKKSDLPQEEWNRYGGLMEYRAHPTVFPEGLAAFQRKLGLPLITHNRWIDTKSPYHQKYKISGIAGVDPGYWKEIADYCKSCGVVTYEQDWLNYISVYSPKLTSSPDLADAFLGGMATACRDAGLSIQYCMPLPWQLVQLSKYANVTTSRVSDDRFQPSHWRDFLYTSRLVGALGTWPWTDVYMSGETDNLLLSVLSGGMVGFGDEKGKENKDNLLKAARADGVLVKPDAAIVPLDASYLTSMDKDAPIVSSTFTDHAGLKTAYVFAFTAAKAAQVEAHFHATDVGLSGPVYVFDFFAGTGKPMDAGADIVKDISPKQASYFIVAPIGRSGIAFLGDRGKFVGTGKQRVATMEDAPSGLKVDLLLAPTESSVTLGGYAPSAPQVTAQAGTAGDVHYDGKTQYFSVEIKPDLSRSVQSDDGDPVRRVQVRLAIR